jgi:hypothetical protein
LPPTIVPHEREFGSWFCLSVAVGQRVWLRLDQAPGGYVRWAKRSHHGLRGRRRLGQSGPNVAGDERRSHMRGRCTARIQPASVPGRRPAWPGPGRSTGNCGRSACNPVAGRLGQPLAEPRHKLKRPPHLSQNLHWTRFFDSIIRELWKTVLPPRLLQLLAILVGWPSFVS